MSTNALAVKQTIALQHALLETQKKVNINIGMEDLKTLKAGGYKLCFAKKVGEHAFNVVWQSYGEYLMSNEFSWTPQYQLFGSNQFSANVKVKVSTNLVKIGLGETSVLDSAGVLGEAATGGPDTGFTMINDYDKIHPGVNQVSTGPDGTMVSTPIYVATNAIIRGEAFLKPVEEVLVWFEQNIETSTMFSESRSESIQIDLTSVNSATRLFSDQKWSTPK